MNINDSIRMHGYQGIVSFCVNDVGYIGINPHGGKWEEFPVSDYKSPADALDAAKDYARDRYQQYLDSVAPQRKAVSYGRLSTGEIVIDSWCVDSEVSVVDVKNSGLLKPWQNPQEIALGLLKLTAATWFERELRS